GGLGLVPGQQYCYLLVACFPEGVESIASEEFCAELVKDRPVMTRVSVEETGVNNGRIHVEWAKPTELDTLSAFPGPYRYNVYRTTDISAGFTFITQTSASANLYQSDTIFLDSNLNTEDFQYYYFVEMLSGEDTVGPSSVASSIFLSSQPRDNRLILSWQENVPWTNLEYEVYREQPLNSDNFILLAVVTEPTYIDSNLANGVEFCYRIQSRGRYSSPGFIDPILNFSQEHCNIPEDNEPPCPPVAFIESDCELERTNTITWGNPNLRCPETDDVVAYNVYFSPVLGQPLELLASLPSRDDTVYLDPNLESVAGCYAVTAVDSFQNESVFSDGLCVDNCPIYNLPNVFTPGGDGFNDLFVPFPYRFVESIDLKVFNRWGELVFETTDPDIRWNGEHMDTNQQLSDGVFYYECTVNEIRLQGIVPRLLRGYFHIMNQESSGNGS
ncbi:MAG: gliding motility-associated C-terminal domain-containing protein, partial [Bacteroidota bacterium]